MKHKNPLTLVIAAFLLGGLTDLHAQQMPEPWIDGTAKARLRSVYELGQFRAKGFSARWSKDSRGYSVQERDPRTKKTISVYYDVRTGEKIEAKQSGQKTADSRPLVSPGVAKALMSMSRVDCGRWKLVIRPSTI